MKIAVQGSVIETDLIYLITPIKGDNCWGERSTLKHSGYSFEIKFLNGKLLEVNLRGEELFGDNWFWDGSGTDEIYNKRIEIVKEKLEKFREKIINVWNNFLIPQIPRYEIDLNLNK